MSRNWSVEELIRIAQTFDQQAARARERRASPLVRVGKYEHHSSRKMAFNARKFARYKVMSNE